MRLDIHPIFRPLLLDHATVDKVEQVGVILTRALEDIERILRYTSCGSLFPQEDIRRDLKMIQMKVASRLAESSTAPLFPDPTKGAEERGETINRYVFPNTTKPCPRQGCPGLDQEQG